MSDKKAEGAAAEGEAKQAGGKEEAGHGGGGIKAFLPLIIMVLLMPLLAFTTTKFLILPKVVQARGDVPHEEGAEHGEVAEAGHGAKDEAADKGHGKEPAKDAGKEKEHGKPKDAKEHGGKPASGKKKQSVPIAKVIVNVAGSMGSRYLMTSFTLVGSHADFKTTIEENKDQLLDLANSAMASKTISDLEKPGARNQLRAELMSIFNNALGSGLVQEIYFTEFAVQ
jgi:flagellar FliL protein